MVWVGPSPESIESFGLKHTARDLATQAGVPIVPGSKGLVTSEEDAVKESERLGFPVMLKATAGGGGMGLATCQNTREVREAFEMVKSRGENLFKNAGMFMERFYPDSHHIEVQVFGNGLGNAIHFGERECSIQRRHQKVIEECPSPFIAKHPGEYLESISRGLLTGWCRQKTSGKGSVPQLFTLPSPSSMDQPELLSIWLTIDPATISFWK